MSQFSEFSHVSSNFLGFHIFMKPLEEDITREPCRAFSGQEKCVWMGGKDMELENSTNRKKLKGNRITQPVWGEIEGQMLG